ncbi:hypothetical protein HaLaN_29859, partial [Haematococcus lacustris]
MCNNPSLLLVPTQRLARLKVIKVPGGAVLRGCKKTRRKLLAHFQLRAELKEDMAEVSMERHGRAKQLVVFFGAASIGTGGGSQEATQPAASEPGPSTPPPAKRSKRTKAEQAAEPTQPVKGKFKSKGKAAKANPAPQPGRWLDRDCNAAPNMQRIAESRWRPLELRYWPDQGALPAKGK